jgi:hypothetical protein
MTIQNFIVNLFELQKYRVRGVEVKGREILVKVELWRKTAEVLRQQPLQHGLDRIFLRQKSR